MPCRELYSKNIVAGCGGPNLSWFSLSWVAVAYELPTALSRETDYRWPYFHWPLNFITCALFQRQLAPLRQAVGLLLPISPLLDPCRPPCCLLPRLHPSCSSSPSSTGPENAKAVQYHRSKTKAAYLLLFEHYLYRHVSRLSNTLLSFLIPV
jgi:hypothetical protein